MNKKVFMFIKPTGLIDRDVACGFSEAGATVHAEISKISITPEGHTVETFLIENIARSLDEFKPDLIFSVNGFGLDNSGDLAEEYAKRGIPYVTWFVDLPKKVNIGNSYKMSNSYLFTFDKTHMPLLRSLGFSNVYYLPLATNPQRFRPLPGIDKERNICFVGGSDYSTIRYLAENIERSIGSPSSTFLEAIDTAITMQTENAGTTTYDIIKNVCTAYRLPLDTLPDLVKDMLEGFVEREASLRLRLKIISRLKDSMNLIVYGDEIWSKILDKNFRAKASYFNDEIVEVYNRHAVHINISKFQLRQAVNQRPFDISACQGFLITDERDDLRNLFSPEEILSYSSTEDLIQKAAYFLDKENERLQMASRARKRVLSDHTFAHRVESIFQTLH